ncbi:MAG: heme exporter protein CcmD [Proteobacteria bacterium]|nr:heme exporter protein CcmD [Pseudomonadota bacterium]MCH9758556.1 heme exporter protein CcmD [Pseudomonadota bacterium]
MLESLSTFIQMGGYGGYVWFCYAAAVAMQAGMIINLWRRRQQLLSQKKQ